MPLGGCVRGFPPLVRLHPFERALLDLTLGPGAYERALARVDALRRSTVGVGKEYAARAARAAGKRDALAAGEEGVERLRAVFERGADAGAVGRCTRGRGAGRAGRGGHGPARQPTTPLSSRATPGLRWPRHALPAARPQGAAAREAQRCCAWPRSGVDAGTGVPQRCDPRGGGCQPRRLPPAVQVPGAVPLRGGGGGGGARRRPPPRGHQLRRGVGAAGGTLVSTACGQGKRSAAGLRGGERALLLAYLPAGTSRA